MNGCEAPQAPIGEAIVHLAVEIGRRRTLQRRGPQGSVMGGGARHQRRRGQEAAFLFDVMADLHQPPQLRGIAVGEFAHDLVGRRAPGGVEVDEGAVFVEENALQHVPRSARGNDGEPVRMPRKVMGAS
jgi:hypothetical protein